MNVPIFTMLDEIMLAPRLEEGKILDINESSSHESILQISFSWEELVHIELSRYLWRKRIGIINPSERGMVGLSWETRKS